MTPVAVAEPNSLTHNSRNNYFPISIRKSVSANHDKQKIGLEVFQNRDRCKQTNTQNAKMGYKRKANSDKPSGANSIEVTKRVKQEDKPAQAVARKNLLVDSDSDSEAESAPVDDGFKVNEEFAKRFEYNKKREELSRRKLYSAHQYTINC